MERRAFPQHVLPRAASFSASLGCLFDRLTRIGDAEACTIPQVRGAFSMENTLPMSGGEADKPPRSSLRGVRVLVVEDHWHVANSLKLFLETEGMEVSGPAATAADASGLAAAQKPDFAVVDINLKGELAYALIDQLHGQGIPIVVVSPVIQSYQA